MVKLVLQVIDINTLVVLQWTIVFLGKEKQLCHEPMGTMGLALNVRKVARLRVGIRCFW